MKEIIDQLRTDPRYQKNIEYGKPRPGHPEGQVKFHIADLEANLEKLQSKGISQDEYWKLKFLIHIHDTFKAEAGENLPILDPQSHASLAREFAQNFTTDTDLLNMIQYHDENYSLWRGYIQKGAIDEERLQKLLHIIQNWDLFLMFLILDGCVPGKDVSKLEWFFNEVHKFINTRVNSSWIITQ